MAFIQVAYKVFISNGNHWTTFLEVQHEIRTGFTRIFNEDQNISENVKIFRDVLNNSLINVPNIF